MSIVPIPLFAYLDPGTGSMLFSIILGIVATSFFVLKSLIFKLVHLPALLAGKHTMDKLQIVHDAIKDNPVLRKMRTISSKHIG